MKKLLFILCAFTFINVSAQSFTETFDSNTLGWTEFSSKNEEAIITEGVMFLKGKIAPPDGVWSFRSASYAVTHCYSMLDVTKNFNIKCEAEAKKISDNGSFGIVLDYMDNGNFIAFVIDNETAYLYRYVNYELVGAISNSIKIKEKKKSKFNLEIKSTYQKLEFFVNGVRAIEARYLPLNYNGFGFYVYGKQEVEFDNVEFIQ